MINTLFLANNLETILNQNTEGIKFLIYADEGDLKKDIKNTTYREKYTFGKLEVISSSIVPLKNISFTNMNTQLMILAELTGGQRVEEGSNKREQSLNFIKVKNCIDELIEKINGQTTTIEDDGKTFNVTIGASLPTTGQKMSFGSMADCLPLFLNVSYNFFENGVNANECRIIINNEDMFFTRLVVSKIRIADQTQFANESGGKTSVLEGGKSIDLTLPVVNSKVSKEIMSDILGNQDNKALAVRIETPLKSENFICIFGNNAVSMDVGMNLGYNISIVEGVKHLLDYTGWVEKELNGTVVSYNMLSKGFIFWGDSTSDYVEVAGAVNHTYNDNETTHEIKVYGGI